jgi:dipeptidyl aminopeptidase/acylaminoacyl peptidase
MSFRCPSRRLPLTKRIVHLVFIFWAILLASGLAAQEPYKLPPKEIVDIVDAPPPPWVMLNPAGTLMLLADQASLPSIADLARPILRLAGIRIVPDLNCSQRLNFFTGLTIKNLADGTLKRADLPQGSKLGPPQWSPDGRWIAFARYTDNGLELWTAEAASGQAKALTPPRLNAVFGRGFTWMPDSRHVLATLVPEGRPDPPRESQIPVGPDVQETKGKFIKAATYQDLLKTPYDQALFEYYATAQLAEIDIADGSAHKLGKPLILTGAMPSPDGRHILLTRIKRPFSYSVPAFSFSRSHEVWSRTGEIEYVLADLPPADEVPLNGVPAGPRSPEWQTGPPATLVWTEALDGGDPEKTVPFRDKILALAAPYKASPQEIMKTKERQYSLIWLGTEGLALVSEYNWKKSWRTTYFLDVRRLGLAPRVVFDLNVQDRYNDPGYPVLATTPSGHDYALLDKDWIYLAGSGASPQGDRPFLDRFNIQTLAKKRLFQSAATRFETFIDFQGNSRRFLIISSESPADPPNYYRLDLNTGKLLALTDFKDPAPQLTGLKKQLIRYKRADGLDLSGTLYLPPGYKQGTRLPAVVWAYPREYTDPGVAGQVRGSANRFTFFRGPSHLFFLTQGYVVLDGAEMPIIGDPKTVNDTFVQQLTDDARAAIDKLSELGVADPARVGVGGHSYGAFMTANLLAHTDLFAAGIARSGAYNRTLTPFGFQNERRTLWEAPSSYINMSPFMFANKINEPILLIHGQADNNSGTFPIQSERLFAALQGFGATARLVMLPYESHGYSARESVLDTIAEMLEWFDRYVKNKR